MLLHKNHLQTLVLETGIEPAPQLINQPHYHCETLTYVAPAGLEPARCFQPEILSLMRTAYFAMEPNCEILCEDLYLK